MTGFALLGYREMIWGFGCDHVYSSGQLTSSFEIIQKNLLEKFCFSSGQW
jgi:hypothetical protein